MKLNHFFRLVVFFMAVCTVLSCSKESITEQEMNPEPEVTTPQPTIFNVHLTDAPTEVEAVNIDLQMVIIKGRNSTDSIALGTNAGIYNLLDFQNGVDTLIASAVLTVDTVKQVRLVLGENNTIVVDGETYDLQTPAAQQSGLKVNVCIPLADLHLFDLLLDFDAEASIVETGNGKYILKPVIHVLEMGDDDDGDDDDGDDDDGDDDDGDDDDGDDDDGDDDDGDDDDGDDDDGDDDDDNQIMLDSLPVGIANYITEYYADYALRDIEEEMLCDSSYAIVISLQQMSEKLDLYFDLDGNYLYVSIKISNGELPDAVIEAIEADYEDYQLRNDSNQLDLADGVTVWYEVKLQRMSEKIRVTFSSEGEFICFEE